MPSLEEIMQMAQNAQAELQKAQDNLDKIEVEGQSGGGLVKIKASAKGRIIGVSTPPGCTELPRMPREPSSTAAVLVMPRTANFEAT